MSDFVIGEIDADRGAGADATLDNDLVGLDSRIFDAASKAGIKGLTPVQKACLPHALAGCDILAKAKTGTGGVMVVY